MDTLESCKWALAVFEKGKRLALPPATDLFDAGLRLAAEVRTNDAEAKRLEQEVADLKEKLYDAATVIFDDNLKISSWKREEQTWVEEAQRLHRIIAAAKARLERFCECYDDPCEFHRLVEED